MPWGSEDAPEHTKQANTPAKKQLWAKIANRTLAQTGNEARAIRTANFVVKKKSGTSQKD